MFKKSISLVLSLVMTLSIGTTAFASDYQTTDYNLTIIEDNEQVRIVETSDKTFIYRTTLNKVANTVDHEIVNKTSKITKVADTVELNDFVMLNDELTLNAKAHELKENTFINYEYTKTYGNPHEWQIRRPKLNYVTWYYYDVTQTPENKEYLEEFQGHVDDINIEEGAVITAIGMTGLSYIAVGATTWGALLTGGALSPAQWQSILVAGGFSAGAATAVAIYDHSCSQAYDAYMEILYL